MAGSHKPPKFKIEDKTLLLISIKMVLYVQVI